MKELSIEEKAKRYDDIIKKANKMHHENCEACQMCIEELIPELKESEDERIRKNLLGYIKGVNEREVCKETLNEWIAWLEKQGEQKVSYTTLVETGNGGINALVTRELPTNGCDEKKPAWSEEDKNRINRLIAYFEDKESFTAEDDIAYANWLKSLKSRVQPKQEWSEEDEVMIKVFDSIIRYIVEVIDKDALERFGTKREELFSWLKSLRPQSQWKPTTEQLRELRCVISGCSFETSVLVELEEDLKKLL